MQPSVRKHGISSTRTHIPLLGKPGLPGTASCPCGSRAVQQGGENLVHGAPRSIRLSSGYHQAIIRLCLRRTCGSTTGRILMKVTAMESSRRRLHHRATQGKRSRAVWPAQCKRSAEAVFWAMIRAGDNWAQNRCFPSAKKRKRGEDWRQSARAGGASPYHDDLRRCIATNSGIAVPASRF